MTHPLKKSVHVVSLGCSKSLVDSEVLMGQLASSGLDVNFEPENGKADVVVINTCGFIHDAKEESVNTILEYIEAKKRGEYEQVYVMGCLSQRYIHDLEKEIPEVKKFFGVNDIRGIVTDLGGVYREELLGERKLSTPSHFAYLKISEGCNRRCTFCAIPSIRGLHVSKPMEDIVSEARRLVAKGVKEIMLIAQDLTHYGIDLYKKNRLSELVENLADIRGIEWVRLHYAYPAGFPDDLLRVIRERPNVCKYLDIPIQHINNRMLLLMKRGHSREQTIHLLEKIRVEIPGVALRTTLIAGFPGETDKEFQELLDFVKDFRFDRLGVFAYSHEEGTTAHKLKDNLPAKLKRDRVGQIMEVQQGISGELNQLHIGQILKTIIDRKEGDFFIGRTEFDSPEIDNEVLIPSENIQLSIGRFYPVTIQRTDYFDLFGTVSHF